MDQRAAELQTRIATVRGFSGLVNAMRGVAATRAQRARRSIEGVDAYARTVREAMIQVLALDHLAGDSPATGSADRSGGRPVLLVFCADQGFCGGFSEQVFDAARIAPGDRLFLIGSQGLRLARLRGIEPEWHGPLIAHADAAVQAAERLHQALAEALARRSAPRVEVIHAELAIGNRYQVHRSRLLPLDYEDMGGRDGARPDIQLPPRQLLDDLTFEYIAATLTRAMLHSHASENVARLQAMAAAHENVRRMAESLQGEERLLRQESITAEILELTAGLRSSRTG